MSGKWSEPDLLRVIFDVGYFPPNTPPAGLDGQNEDV